VGKKTRERRGPEQENTIQSIRTAWALYLMLVATLVIVGGVDEVAHYASMRPADVSLRYPQRRISPRPGVHPGREKKRFSWRRGWVVDGWADGGGRPSPAASGLLVLGGAFRSVNPSNMGEGETWQINT